MKFLVEIIYYIFGEPIKSPPWIKATSNGKLYTDRLNKDYIRFKKDQIEYLMQWSLKNGKMVLDKYQGIIKPNVKDYY